MLCSRVPPRPEVSLNPLTRGGIYFSFSAYSCIHGSIARQQLAGPVSQPLALGLLPVRSVRFGSFRGGRGGSYSDSIRFVAGEGYSLRIRFILKILNRMPPAEKSLCLKRGIQGMRIRGKWQKLALKGSYELSIWTRLSILTSVLSGMRKHLAPHSEPWMLNS